MKTAIFRVDGNRIIGMGHVMRCLALGSAFFCEGYRVIFAMSESLLQSKIEKNGFDFICVDSKYDDYSFRSEVFFDFVKSTAPSIVVVDNYSVKSDYLLQIHKLTKVLYISEEYNPDIVNVVDYFLNYNIYMNSVPPIQSEGVQMLGTKYTLLREEFKKPLRTANPIIKTISIFTGGSDLYNVASGLAQQLVKEEYLREYRIIIVSGQLNPNITELMNLANCNSRINVIIEPVSIADIMDSTSIAISSGGSILYELCSRGIPSISYSIASNQNNIVCEFDKIGLIPYAGNMVYLKTETIKNCVKLVIGLSTSSSECVDISRRMVDLCNKHGAQLIVKMISAENIEL